MPATSKSENGIWQLPKIRVISGLDLCHLDLASHLDSRVRPRYWLLSTPPLTLGVEGVVSQPYNGARANGVTGLMTGVFKGTGSCLYNL